MRALAVVLALIGLAAGCAAGPVTGTPEAVRVPLTAPAGQVVFRVEAGGGMVPADVWANRRPTLTVYGNGAAYVVAAGALGSDRPLGFRRGHVPRAVLVELVALAAGSGLFDDVDFGRPGVSDLPTTSLIFRPGRAPADEASAYALSYTGASDELTPPQRAHRAALRRLLDRLVDSVQEPVDWTPRSIDVSEGYQDADDRALPWPGPTLAGLLTGRSEDGQPCGVVTGTSAATIFTAARGQHTGRWDDGQIEKNLVIRALLPGESGCGR